jgi:hypothetical protein
MPPDGTHPLAIGILFSSLLGGGKRKARLAAVAGRYRVANLSLFKYLLVFTVSERRSLPSRPPIRDHRPPHSSGALNATMF